MKMRSWKHWLAIMVLPTLSACGNLLVPPLPNAVVNAGGQRITLDQITDIVNDNALGDDDKRQALRDLGIEDEDVIDILLTL